MTYTPAPHPSVCSVCSECGAVVPDSKKKIHDEWHLRREVKPYTRPSDLPPAA